MPRPMRTVLPRGIFHKTLLHAMTGRVCRRAAGKLACKLLRVWHLAYASRHISFKHCIHMYDMVMCRRCCAELNVLMQHYHHPLSQLPLVAYQCWHQLANATAFEQLCKACRHTGAPRTWWQLQMANHLIHNVLNDQEEVVISRSVLALNHGPAWLHSWCSRWGFTGEHISTLTLQPLAALKGWSTDDGDCCQTEEYASLEAMPCPALYVPCTF